MVPMVQRHAVQVLLAAGHSQRETAALTRISERTVRRIAHDPPVAADELVGPRTPGSVGRPSPVTALRALVEQVLTDAPQTKTVEILHRLKLAGYRGGKTAVYAMVRAMRQTRPDFLVRFEGLPGEFTQHDFGEVWVTFADGQRRKVRFFASRLKFSRYVAVTIVPNQKVETLVRVLVAHFERFGGIPLLAVFDRPKTIAEAWDRSGQVTRWNDTFARTMFSLGVGVELCWPYRPQQKGAVENLVGWVKGSFFKQRRFVDMDDLLAQLEEWLREINTERPCRATGQTPASRLGADQARLRPLRTSSAGLALPFATTVGPTGEVTFEGRRYAMPPEAIGLSATLYLYSDQVRITAGRYAAEHPRLFEIGAVSRLPEHRAQHLAVVAGERGRRYLQRQHLLDLGSPAAEFLSELVHRRPRTWFHDVQILHDLLQSHGDAPLRCAFEQALAAGVCGAEYVRLFLESPADLAQPEVRR